MFLNFVSVSKNSVALRRYLLSNGVMNISRVLHESMPHFCTNSGISNKESPKISYLKDDSNVGPGAEEQIYPDWLWNLKGTKQALNELDPHSRTYSRLLRKSQRRDENEQRKMKRF